MEMVRRAFPPSVMSESVIRKVLKQFADFKREGKIALCHRLLTSEKFGFILQQCIDLIVHPFVVNRIRKWFLGTES